MLPIKFGFIHVHRDGKPNHPTQNLPLLDAVLNVSDLHDQDLFFEVSQESQLLSMGYGWSSTSASETRLQIFL
jgi:hypothetical protein